MVRNCLLALVLLSRFWLPVAAAVEPTMPAELLERVKESVVFIQVQAVSYLDDDNVAPRFEASGTGFVVSRDGRIVTNWHVVDSHQEERGLRVPLRRSELQVIFRAGTRRQRAYPARLLAADPQADLAILAVDRDDCVPLPLGESDGLRETVPVWISGFPFGALFTVLQRGPAISINRGHITSLRHDDRGILRQIQFDAAVNRGNSGGPLLAADGRVYGIANIALGTSRVNFAIPVARLRALLERAPLEADYGEDCTVSIASDPPGAAAYLDGTLLGTTPLRAVVPGGYRHLQLQQEGFRQHGEFLSVHDGLRVERALAPVVASRLQVVDEETPPPQAEPAAAGERWWSEDFVAAESAEDWDQETGGNEQERTWYVEGGALHQFADDGLLHAVFAGDQTWGDYELRARMRIARNRGDGRAGLIVRAGDDGFVLVRFHSQTRQVQIAQHLRRPFGWTVLAARPLTEPVGVEQWHDLTVQVRGRHLLALLDEEPVIETVLPEGPSAHAGRIGFYAVEARASFAAAQVAALPSGDAPQEDMADPGVRSFWFNDPFQEEQGHWRAFGDGEPAAPWRFVPGALMPGDADAGLRIAVLERYHLHDYQGQVVFSADGGRSGVLLRGTGSGGLMAVVDGRGRTAQLIEQDAEGRRILASTALPGDGAEDPGFWHLTFQLSGATVQVAINQQARMRSDAVSIRSGHLGLIAEDGRALFHFLGASSLQ